ncbi:MULTISPECIES: sodium:solute symporter family protein [Rhodococcus]|jgi:SSS family solute:Na+ symporter|uniref:Solute:Na+ symporter, SSS family n=1 Tax=Rhodococcus koreensis TaxID=99653 RepID=A0A1H5CES2_9NOCA|nr:MULTISPECIES: sodium:solute symporter family protein [Rhodococcus]SED65087.1 solute:Na+ symporter, SSS family [Rhodococcus koreensis]
MNMLVGYGSVAVFFLIVVAALELTKRKDATFSEYATAGRSFGSFFGTMAFLNTWLPGTMFISFAGLAAGAGVIGFYSLIYSLLAVVLMFFLAKPVHDWGKRYDLRTQADLLGARYNSRAVRVVAALIGIAASFPWIVLGMQSLALVFQYLSFGRIGGATAVLIGIMVIGLRQIWTIRFGMRGVIISDMVQGIVAYFVGTLVILGLLTWLVSNGHGFGDVDPTHFELPGPGSALGPLYLSSLILTGALGGWCWPDIFVRLFTARSAATIKRSAVQAAPVLLIFGAALTLMAIAASSVPGVAEAPDDVWFIAAGVGGIGLITVAGICVVAATMGNVGANLQALGTQTANDIIGVAKGVRVTDPRIGRIAVGVLTLLAALGASATVGISSGLITLALISYQGICQLAPTLFLGIFWRKGTAAAAVSAMSSGFATAAVLQWLYPVSIPWLGGLTSGVAALAVNAAVYVAVTYSAPMNDTERNRVGQLFDRLSESKADPDPESRSSPDTESDSDTTSQYTHQ